MIKIISGGQDGIDIAALRAAKRAGLQTGGFMPSGFYTASGFKRKYEQEYGMVQREPFKSLSAAYSDRTTANVNASDVTIIMGTDLQSPGTKCTKNAVKQARRDMFLWDLSPNSTYDIRDPEKRPGLIETLALFLCDGLAVGMTTFNFAGNRDRALEEPVEAFLFEVFTLLKERSTEGQG